MKKLLVLLLSVLMCLSLAGCSGGGNKTEDNRVTITFDISTLYIVPDLEATQGTEDALNDYLLNTLGETEYKVHLIVTSVGEYFSTKIPMELASGGEDCPDIIQVSTLSNDVGNGYLQSLDPYLDNELKKTTELIGNTIECGKVGGSVYMIPRYFGIVLDYKWIYNKDLAESEEAKAAGVDTANVVDIDTLAVELGKLKEVYPDEHFTVFTDSFPVIYRTADHTSLVGTYAATIGQDTTLVNYYETEAYQKAINKAREFHDNGWADPEGSLNTLGHDAITYSGSSKGVIMGHSAEAEGIANSFTKNNTYGANFGAKTICINDKYTDTLGIGITYTCKNPSAAARFIDLLYTDEYVWDTLIYGVEGRDYLWNDDHTKLKYPEGLEFATVPYEMAWSCGMVGNGFYTKVFEGSTDSNSNPQYGMDLLNNGWVPPLYGFNPSNDNVFNEVAAISNVVSKYDKVLTYGDVDPAVEYQNFLAELKEAGIDKVIADYQAQVNEWLKTK